MDRELLGGNMSVPKLNNNRIYKDATIASDNIHALLCFARKSGITWIPKSYGIDSASEKHVLSYLDGEALHNMPNWIWDEQIIEEMAKHLREWHDVTAAFVPVSDKWLLPTDGSKDVICHNDFAPYNWIFENRRFVGLIDFDTCAPGSRLWDICYTAYRMVPLMPNDRDRDYHEYSQFDTETMLRRLTLFLTSYAGNARDFTFSHKDVIKVLQDRLSALAAWSYEHGHASGNEELFRHADMYSLHRDWIGRALTI